jgi:hypothetical protein
MKALVITSDRQCKSGSWRILFILKCRIRTEKKVNRKRGEKQ